MSAEKITLHKMNTHAGDEIEYARISFKRGTIMFVQSLIS